MRLLPLPIAFVILFAFARASAAAPITIVDTGPGVSPNYTLGGSSVIDQWLAAEFIVTQSWIITEVQGWIDPGNSGDVRYRLYSDGGQIPGSVLFEQSLAILGTGATTWYGPSGLSWAIGPGSYWLAFERPGTFSGTMPGSSPNPLVNEAFRSASIGPQYNESVTLDLGVRIFAEAADAAAVPEPATLSLLGLGLVGAAAVRYRRRRYVYRSKKHTHTRRGLRSIHIR